MQRFLSVRPLINSSIYKFDEVLYVCVLLACGKFLAAELAEIVHALELQIEPSLCIKIMHTFCSVLIWGHSMSNQRKKNSYPNRFE